MSLITDHVKENAEKCKNCAFQKMRSGGIDIDKNSVLFDEAVMVIEGMSRASCAVCPFEKDFEKVYGMKPYEYFPNVLMQKKAKS